MHNESIYIYKMQALPHLSSMQISLRRMCQSSWYSNMLTLFVLLMWVKKWLGQKVHKSVRLHNV